MQEAGPIDSNKLEFSPYSPLDDFSNLDFRDRDNQDPLDVDKFIHDNPQYNVENNLSAIFSVRYENNLVAYFTLSMSIIQKKEMQPDDVINTTFQPYPALLLGLLGVEKNYQGRGIGQNICKFCRGIGQELNDKAACAFLILRTTAKLAKLFYEPKCNFKWKPKDEGKAWMYYRLFTTKKRYISENIPFSASPSMKIKRVGEKEFHEP